MYIQKNSFVSFNARISERVYKQIWNQVAEYPLKKKNTKKVNSQIENIKNWGNPDSEIVICKNYSGFYRLGLQSKSANGKTATVPFKDVRARTELSQFLKIREHDILNAENLALKGENLV